MYENRFLFTDEILLGDTFKTITEKDFNRYYREIFSLEFIKALNNIKSKDLFSGKEDIGSNVFLSTGGYHYRMFCRIDCKNEMLILNFSICNECGNDYYSSDHNKIFYFKIINNTFIFHRIMLAG